MIGDIDMNFYKKNKKGFTLIEIILSLGIFSAVILLTGSIYVFFTNIQARTKASQSTLNNANYILELMSRELRNSVLYDYNPSIDECHDYVGAQYDHCILFKRPNGQLASFARRNLDIASSTYPDLLYIILDCGPLYSTSSCSWSTTNYDAYTDLFLTTLSKVQLENLEFYITPTSDPYFDESVNQQPRVTINLLINQYEGREIEQISQQLQTTVTTRIFDR